LLALKIIVSVDMFMDVLTMSCRSDVARNGVGTLEDLKQDITLSESHCYS
jgi:hypothetical protein